jgi:hypothetical protein
MNNTVLKFETKPKAVVIRCEACGATADAACSCGAAYVPVVECAAKAVAATPQKSDRAIAAQLGIDHKTVAKARRAGGELSPPQTRIGRDGKTYPMPKARPNDETAEVRSDDEENVCHTEKFYQKTLYQFKRGIRAYTREMKRSQRRRFYREAITWLATEDKMRTRQAIAPSSIKQKEAAVAKKYPTTVMVVVSERHVDEAIEGLPALHRRAGDRRRDYGHTLHERATLPNKISLALMKLDSGSVAHWPVGDRAGKQHAAIRPQST